MKILVVDDSSFMRTMLSNILGKAGYTDVVEAHDGEQAITLFKKEKPELVLLDIIMEKKEGIEVLKEMKKTIQGIKVIMISAIGQQQMIEEAMKAGAVGYIVKPFDEKKIIETIKNVSK